VSGGTGVTTDAATRHAVTRTIVAMGTTVTASTLSSGPDAATGAALEQALDWFREVETCCTRFEPGSELQRLCGQPGAWVLVSPLLFQAVRFAIDVAARTDGAFDPCVGHVLHRAGYDRHHATGEVAPLVAGDGTWRDVECDPATGRIRLRCPLQLDLGAVAKGMAIDLAAQVLAARGDFFIDAGGDVFASGHNASGTPWRVGIRDPFAPASLVDTIPVDGRAVCTSGTYERGAHLIDGHTREVAQGLASVTVLAPTAMAADAASTAALVLGPVDGVAFLEAEGLSALVIDGDGTVRRVGDWPR
jgi:thiamine biosynthesis lipoprotein